ncbi:MAG: PQQ-like beta-propeller repeat protein [Cytophagaceae bacterium]|nr:PQQ-like beta-propeller repeat protein [Cytophagaceae bacterium]
MGVKKEVELNNITSDDKIIFGSWDGKVYSLDAGKGTIKWDFDTGWTGMHKTDYFNGMALVGSTGKLISIDINTGIKKWEFLSNTEKGVFASGATVVNNIAYIGCNDFFVYAINATTGIKIWEFKTGGYNQSKPFVVNNIVYIGSLDKKVYAIDALTGLKKWDYTLGGATTNSPTVSDGILYIGSEDKKIHAIDAITGEKNGNS